MSGEKLSSTNVEAQINDPSTVDALLAKGALNAERRREEMQRHAQEAASFANRMREPGIRTDSRGNILTPKDIAEIEKNGADKDDVLTRW